MLFNYLYTQNNADGFLLFLYMAKNFICSFFMALFLHTHTYIYAHTSIHTCQIIHKQVYACMCLCVLLAFCLFNGVYRHRTKIYLFNFSFVIVLIPIYIYIMENDMGTDFVLTEKTLSQHFILAREDIHSYLIPLGRW